jgi:hypothetical protein
MEAGTKTRLTVEQDVQDVVREAKRTVVALRLYGGSEQAFQNQRVTGYWVMRLAVGSPWIVPSP